MTKKKSKDSGRKQGKPTRPSKRRKKKSDFDFLIPY